MVAVFVLNAADVATIQPPIIGFADRDQATIQRRALMVACQISVSLMAGLTDDVRYGQFGCRIGGMTQRGTGSSQWSRLFASLSVPRAVMQVIRLPATL